MMNVMVFGIGAAGNKAAIEAIEEGKIAEEKVKLVNTTTKDIPEKYKIGKDMIVQFSSMLGGCGKEPDKGYETMATAINEDKIDFFSMVPEEVQQIVLVTSTEGGTGCGATPAMVQYFNDMGLPVHVFALIGFQDELRGIDNTLKFFKRVGDDIILHTIMNDQFLDYTGSYTKAEELANKEFARQLEVIIGSKLIPSEQNMDDTDMWKATTTKGYMDIKTIDMAPIKTVDQFKDAVVKTFENPNCLRYDAACQNLSLIINGNKSIWPLVNNNDSIGVIKRYAGNTIEVYRQLQDDDSVTDTYVDIMVSGLPFPEQAIKDISNHYKTEAAKMTVKKKSMSDIFDDIDVGGVDQFNTQMTTRKRPGKISMLGETKKPKVKPLEPENNIENY